jgi:hypothetical protein
MLRVPPRAAESSGTAICAARDGVGCISEFDEQLTVRVFAAHLGQVIKRQHVDAPGCWSSHRSAQQIDDLNAGEIPFIIRAQP